MEDGYDWVRVIAAWREAINLVGVIGAGAATGVATVGMGTIEVGWSNLGHTPS
jgi:hypothetical protein